MSHRQRALYVIVFLCFGFTLISLRLVHVMLHEESLWTELAISNHLRSIELPPRRGAVVDANGDTLAQTHVLYDVRIDGQLVKDPEQELGEMARLLELSPTMLVKAFNPKNRYWLIKNDVDEDVIRQLQALKLRCLVPPEKKFVRGYPNGSQASHVLGFLSAAGRGASGVELLMEKALRGAPGERWIEKDGRQIEIAAYRRKDLPPRDGYTVRLTLDMTIQHAVEEGLDRIEEQYQPLAAYVIVLRPRTGEILAMANRPTFDPNDRASMTPGALRNRCLTDIVEPGSIFKVVPIAGMLNEGLVTLDTEIFCEGGAFYYGGHTLHDTHPHDVLTVTQVMAYSSNIGTVKIALLGGPNRFYDYTRAFGFGEETHLLPGQAESGGLLRPVSTWQKIAVARLPIGQGIGVTPIQMANAMAVIANGGALMQPKLVKELVDADGRVVQRFEPRKVRQVISAAAAADTTAALRAVVAEGGTGTSALVPGFSSAGKTGTAQKFVDGEYSKEKYVASFVGFLPATNPEFVMLVMVDEPQGTKYYGGQVAAPAFSEMAQKVAQCLNLVPDIEVPRAEPVRREIQTARNTVVLP